LKVTTKQVLRVNSLTLGLIPPELTPLNPPLVRGEEKGGHECCGYDHSHDYSVFIQKLDSPSLFELDLARRPHRWREVRELTNSFLKSCARAVTIFEANLLKVLELPNINEVRQSIIESDKFPSSEGRTLSKVEGLGVGAFAHPGFATLSHPSQEGNSTKTINDFLEYDKQVTPELEIEIDKLLNTWLRTMVGEKGNIGLNDMPIYQYHILSGFSIGVDKTRAEIEKELPNPPPPVTVNLENLYVAKITDEGLKRIQTKIGKQYKKEILSILETAAEQGLNPLQTARNLHNAIGEGQMWYWNRIARSETALALDAAFVAESKNAGVPYEKWSTTGNPCPICAPLDGKIWRVGEGPRVIYGTHPHCLCVKYIFIGQPNVLQDAVDHGAFPYL
jgi:hypothetical protein